MAWHCKNNKRVPSEAISSPFTGGGTDAGRL